MFYYLLSSGIVLALAEKLSPHILSTAGRATGGIEHRVVESGTLYHPGAGTCEFLNFIVPPEGIHVVAEWETIDT